MAILSGKNASSAYSDCGLGMDHCEHFLIWNKFKEAGYMTAFGEDYLRLPDTFSALKGFTLPPTDHYARPLFLIGEYTKGNLICTRNKPSAQHLLEYALQFADAYKTDNFFGYFWINSYSHNLHNLPTLFEDNLIKFFEKLKNNGSEDFLINTPGCTIPNYSKSLHFIEPTDSKSTCYDRVVFVERSTDVEVTFRIDRFKIVQHAKQSLNCFYRFALRSDLPGKEDSKLRFTQYMLFENGTKAKLEEEVIEVYCNLLSENGKKVLTYSDAYLILKKKRTDTLRPPLRENVVLLKENWNILMVGMDTMSRGRAYHSLPFTIKYLQDNEWLDYRGYQKVAVNTFPNVMAILSGKNASSAYSDCGLGMDHCEHFLIWNKFKEAGYMTAFGEDYLRLPDTFSALKGFTLPPTDHYARPLFLIGEYTKGNLICTRNKPSAQHLLEYALQFADAYKTDNFFGYFWINSYSHNLHNLPTLFEDNLIKFFEKLKNNGMLDNTFIFFLSDHGVRFGQMRIPRESYYEERLPMLFMWVPYEFRETYPNEYRNLQINQYRLTTPYDVHATLLDFMKKTSNHVDTVPPEACPSCTSLTKEIFSDRTCAAAHVDQKWCTCHSLTKASRIDSATKQVLDLAVKYVQDRANSVKTYNCTRCSPLTLKKMLRNDSYTKGNKTYFVVAFQFKPGDVSYEATVEKDGEKFKILHPTDTITGYNIRGKCAINSSDRAYCVCIKSNKCKNK